ncbi:sensor histidine kinase [Spongiactinospora rosea]|uniref:histidine kinase n=1 Tax=Spongiactinospora rosea TaxID=2248750 RepID=A0A366LK04_9ACTN|nr:sensor histidine kinase [Spongiactinospora rosea]RBQ13823.1 sensor histidine kinase [Spongiactinospora rosea]
MVVVRAAVRGMVGLVLGAVMAVVELAWVVIAMPLLAVPSTRPWSFRGAGRLAEADRVRVNRWLGGAVAPGLAGRRAPAYVAMRGIVGGLGGGVLVLIGIWVAVSWRVLSGGTGERAEMSWYDPITWAAFIVLVVFLAVLALIGLAALERRLAVWGLAPSDKEVLRRRVEQLSRTRAEVLEAVDDERRRIERDLHDGVQQRLVALGMLLGRAHRLDDSGAAATLFRQAREESRRALEELREVAWRIHPVALDDGGLPAALESLVERSSVPIDLDYDVSVRLGPAQETVAYFVVCEAVTNALKHSQAQRVEIEVRQAAGMLRVRVSDDGVGNARADGRGLSGLARRVAACDGRFDLDSPAGGPTTLRAELPCA